MAKDTYDERDPFLPTAPKAFFAVSGRLLRSEMGVQVATLADIESGKAL